MGVYASFISCTIGYQKIEGYNVLIKKFILTAALLLTTSSIFAGTQYPQIMGMAIGNQSKYADLVIQADAAKLDMIILGFYKGYDSIKMNGIIDNLKNLNPNILIGQYTVLGETQDNCGKLAGYRCDKVQAENWWLRLANGNRTQWTTIYNAYDINVGLFSTPDANGDRYPEWLVKTDYDLYFNNSKIDIWFLDNWGQARAKGDWNKDGIDEDKGSTVAQSISRQGHLAEIASIRSGPRSDIKIMGNAGSVQGVPEMLTPLDFAYLECNAGMSWSIEGSLNSPTKWGSWRKMMDRYIRVGKSSVVGFGVCDGDPTNKIEFLYWYGSYLLGAQKGAYFSYTAKADSYSMVTRWFPEYDIDLGGAVDPPQVEPSADGFVTRKFEKGTVRCDVQKKECSINVIGIIPKPPVNLLIQ